MAYLIKPFQRSELVPAVHVALARFREDQNVNGTVGGVNDDTKRLMNQAKAVLMDRHGKSEADAITYLQKDSEDEISVVAQSVVDGTATV